MAANDYYGSIPAIQQAYQNDPKNKLAQSMIAAGTSLAPVAQGSWGVPDGLARAAQAIVGSIQQKKYDKKYSEREAAFDQWLEMKVASAAGGQQRPMANPAAANPAGANPAMSAAASALAPAPNQIAPGMAAGGPQGAQMAPQAPPMPMGGQMPPGGPPIGVMAMPPAASGIAGPMQGAGAAAMSGDMPSALELYRRGIRPIEGGTDPKTGAFRTSPKGAVGPGQIMPGTGPEAARLAGLPWDEGRFKSDAKYNDALGAAYYAKQLQDFGDPVKAAAAYNAGPGRVRRAMRQATRSGQDYTAHLPDETQTYVQKFAQDTQPNGAWTGGAPQPPQAQMEAVPNDPPAPPSQAPQAPTLPGEVQSSRIPMAQMMLQSGNPDLAAIAQTYLDKGLDEQNSARTLASQQQFQQGQTGYSSALADYQNANEGARQDAYSQRREAQQRNFTREQTQNAQQFQHGERVGQQQFQHNERIGTQQYGTQERTATQAFQAEQQRIQNTFTSSENQLNRDSKESIAAQRAQQAQGRSAYFSTPTGLKMQQEAGAQINKNTQAIGQLERFMTLNEKQRTGGFVGATTGYGPYSAVNSQVAEMFSLSNAATLSAIGGSLGTAISDGDRKFVMQMTVNPNLPKQTNDNIARAQIGVLRRQNDYVASFANAQADGKQGDFNRNWAQYAKSVPIVQYDKNGNAVATDKPMTYDEWQQSRPRFNAKGQRIN